jgi:glutathione S-transferase
MRLYYMPGAGSMVPHAALAEAGAEYELVLVEEDDAGRRPQTYRHVNPFGLVPSLEDGDLILTDTLAITLHIADRYPDSGLAPAIGTRLRSELYRWLAYFATTVQPTFLHRFHPERFISEAGGQEAVVAAAVDQLRTHLDWIDGRLADRQWLVGDAVTCADLHLFMLTLWGDDLDPPSIRRPNLANHYGRLQGRASIRRMMSEEGF